MKHEKRKSLTDDFVEICREIDFADPATIHDVLKKFVEYDLPVIELKIVIEGSSHVFSEPALRALTEMLRRIAPDRLEADDERGERLVTAFPESPARWAARADEIAVEALRLQREVSLGSNPIFAVQRLQQIAGNDGDLLLEAARRPWLESDHEAFVSRSMAELRLDRSPATGTRQQVQALLNDAARPLTDQATVRRSSARQ